MHLFLNFKNFAEATLDLFRPLTVLIGPNASGKSNAIEGVELLSQIAWGGPLHEIVEFGNTPDSFGVRGGLQSCPRYGKDRFGLGFGAGIAFEGQKRPISYLLSVMVRPRRRIATESLWFHDGPMLFETVESTDASASGDITVRYNNFARGGAEASGVSVG